jgi:hypothetical protein
MACCLEPRSRALGVHPYNRNPWKLSHWLELMLRLVEMFASHPPQRTRKDGAPSWLAGLKAGPNPR